MLSLSTSPSVLRRLIRRHLMNLRFASRALSAIAVLLMLAGSATAQQAGSPPAAAEASKGTFLLTIFLKHDQSKSLEQIQSPLRAPAERLREVNRAIEQTAWGGYRTEFYPSYDYKAIGEELHAKAQSQ